jgi:hypothetical protein
LDVDVDVDVDAGGWWWYIYLCRVAFTRKKNQAVGRPNFPANSFLENPGFCMQ